MEVLITIWTILLLIFGGSGGQSHAQKPAHTRQTAATPTQTTPSIKLAQPTSSPQSVPTPALLPGLIGLWGSLLRKRPAERA